MYFIYLLKDFLCESSSGLVHKDVLQLCGYLLRKLDVENFAKICKSEFSFENHSKMLLKLLKLPNNCS